MLKPAYYNEFEPYAAKWLRNLIAKNLIAPGDVDERSIEDVTPDDLKGYRQCHFFAGIGVWSYALRRAGWRDDEEVWTGSCPCQPFSAAGKGEGFADDRHLWPSFAWLIRERKPAAILGEQVASKAALPWIDLVHADLEAMGYAFGCVPFPSAGVGAPHIRDRTYWLAYSSESRRKGGLSGRADSQWQGIDGYAGCSGPVSRLEHTGSLGFGEVGAIDGTAGRSGFAGDESTGGMAYAELQQRPDRQSAISTEYEARGRQQGAAKVAGLRGDMRPGPVNGIWRDADWLLCRDGKWRPVRSGSFPLADGAPSRVGRLRAYGNAINAEAATEFIKVAMACRP